MSNNTLLLSTDTPTKPPPQFGHDHTLLIASCSIPLFWYMLFDEGSIVTAQEPLEDGSLKNYLALSKPTVEALGLARHRWPDVRGVVGARTEKLFTAWATFVEGKAASYLHCETLEWSWLFSGVSAFESELRTCIRAFNHPPRRCKGRLVLNQLWRTLLDQSQALGQGIRSGLWGTAGTAVRAGIEMFPGASI